MSALSPTRRALRATLPARGRDRNGATRRNDESHMQFPVLEGMRIADAVLSLPSTGRVVREANRVG